MSKILPLVMAVRRSAVSSKRGRRQRHLLGNFGLLGLLSGRLHTAGSALPVDWGGLARLMGCPSRRTAATFLYAQAALRGYRGWPSPLADRFVSTSIY